MILGFRKTPDGKAQMIESYEDFAEARRQGGEVWVDIEAPTDSNLKQLDAIINLDDAALEDCLVGEQEPRIDEYDDYIFTVLYGAFPVANSGDIEYRKLAAFCGNDYLITIHRESLKTITTTLGRCRRHPEQTIAHGADFILYLIIDTMVDNLLLVADGYERRLDTLEDESLRPHVGDDLLEDVAELRYDLLELRRMASSQREVVAPLGKGEYDHVSENLGLRFGHVRDHLTKVVEEIDMMRDRLGGVRDNYLAAINLRLNAIMKTLTLFATIMLPLTLFAGIYGMNFDTFWPPSDDPMGFWIVLGLMGVMGVILYMIFRRKRWI